MSSLAPTLQAFFTYRLAQQRQASAHTVAAYRDTFRQLFAFLHQRSGKAPSQLAIEDLDAPVIGAFLENLEHGRGNSVRTRNARLAAVRSFFHFAAFRHPEQAALIQRVLAIPQKRFTRALVSFLTGVEIDALLAAPDRSSWIGRRDRTLLLMAVQTGLRVAELTGLTCRDVELGSGAHVRCHGKGRKDRCTPLTTQAALALRMWMRERQGQPGDPLFPTIRGGALDQMDTLKSLAALTGTVHVLVGTYELLGMTNLSAQLSRRSVEIHFGRYRADSAEDRLALKSVVLTFQRHLPLAEEPDLVGCWEALYEGSLGCVGVLKSWLNRTLAYALAHDAVTLTRRHLERPGAPTRTLLNLAQEIAEGEAALREDPRVRDELRMLLGLAALPAAKSKGAANWSAAQSATGAAPRRPTGRVVQRRPTRDPVGVGEART